MSFLKVTQTVLAVIALAATLSLVAGDVADARRGGGFGSRGARTFQAPAVTRTAPGTIQPIDRTMTARPQPTGPAAAGQPAPARPGLFGGMGGLFGALAVGGLLGMALGTGFGGAGGIMSFLLQLGILAVVVSLVMRFMARRRQGAVPAGAAMPGLAPGMGGCAPAVPRPAARKGQTDEIGIKPDDFESFERLLAETQAAFGREDYGALRRIATPEIVSYLSEELSQNATRGVRNEVSDVKLLSGDLAESWREGAQDYATVAMRYESRDVLRNRTTGALVEGDPDRPTDTTEVWTFVRPTGGQWKLSAIQDA